ncbi:MAG: glucosidase [Phycisphaeraceae bacterium]
MSAKPRKSSPTAQAVTGVEAARLQAAHQRTANWQRWGPYLPERQWATVREDYSADGTCWEYFPHDHARSRAYRWGEDGLLGITDRQCRLCFAVALWNERDPILKERLYGLTGPEGNHGEDVKEEYAYLDSTPTHSYMKAVYKYPQAEFPYRQLVEENSRRGLEDREFELTDTGVFDDNRYFDVVVEYAKASPDDILICITVHNRGPDAAPLHVLPTLWFRNTWSWGCRHEGCTLKPHMALSARDHLVATHESLGAFSLWVGPQGEGNAPDVRFTDNQTNTQRLYGQENVTPWVKDAFDRYVVHGEASAVNPQQVGTKAAPHYILSVPAGGTEQIRLRLVAGTSIGDAAAGFDDLIELRERESATFYESALPKDLDARGREVFRQASAGLLWSKQFYHYVIEDWLTGDPNTVAPPARRRRGRNAEWPHLYSRDVLSVPDKWEYPWFAAWDLAFHMLPLARVDAQFAKDQLVLLLREWYMHPNGQMPAYEFALSDVNPPVHAWAAWRVYKIAAPRAERDRVFLHRVFAKLLLNFTWWVNRKDADGRNLFSGGFLGLDNIGVFDRSKPLPTGGALQQADGTAWMAFYCLTMMDMALELAHDGKRTDMAHGDMASKFFEHFLQISDAINSLGGTGLWDEQDGFYYDQIQIDGGAPIPLKVRSLVGLMPLIAVTVLEQHTLDELPGFKKRFEWFLENRRDLAGQISFTATECCPGHHRWLLAIPSKQRLVRVLRYLLDEEEFLSPFGIRSLSKFHAQHPYVFRAGAEEFRVDYAPGEGTSYAFGGNSNWRGPIWFPINYLLIEALERYHHYFGDTLKVECPTGSGRYLTLKEVAMELSGRLLRLFLPDESGVRPSNLSLGDLANRPEWRDQIHFHEYFHAETGQGLGAAHQTGWTSLAASLALKRRKG